MAFTLPKLFIEKMKNQLPSNEWEAFFAVYDKEAYKGVRNNPLKGDKNKLQALLPFSLTPSPWEENAFYTDEEKVGASPLHFAGAFYSQEPSASSVVPNLQVKPGERVLDLCSAPGGKATQIAGYMQGEGILVANEPVFSRAKILSQNIERLGVANAIVVSALPEELVPYFTEYFDKILVDAPCSGEGMFRKNSEMALKEWSKENVELCADRQKGILQSATKMLKKGGRLVYSTCTFSVEEDEMQVENYLKNHPQMRLIRQEKIYPHRQKGEGHFFAVFEKADEMQEERVTIKMLKPVCQKQTEKAYEQFAKEFFFQAPQGVLHEVNGVVYKLPKDVFSWQGLQVLRAGLRLGEMQNGRFVPSHSLAMATHPSACKNVVNLAIDDTRVEKYLRGETIDVDGENGWCLVCVEGYGLGLGKRVGNVVKNHLPKGLRKVK